MPPKRKAVDDHWVPTVPAPATPYYPYTTTSNKYPLPSSSGYSPGAGSASNPIVLDSPPKAKRARNTKVSQPPAEKRGAIFKKACPKNIIERVERVMAQRFYMIDRRREGDELKEEFSVLGSTGNVYKVVIEKKPSCNCPDASKGNHCKHILFIFLKVLQVTQRSGYWYQKALLTSELEDIFANAPRAPAAIAHERIRNAYAQATGKKVASSSQPQAKKRLPEKDDDCPVCYDSMHKAEETNLVFCEECGNGLHKDCFQQWAKSAKNGVTCVFCRSQWPAAAPTPSGTTQKTARISEGYLNLSTAAGINPIRDTSSYYHGPSRGSRFYGYCNYDDYDDSDEYGYRF